MVQARPGKLGLTVSEDVLVVAALLAMTALAATAALLVIPRSPAPSTAIEALHAAVEEVAYKPGCSVTLRLHGSPPLKVSGDSVELSEPLPYTPSLPDPAQLGVTASSSGVSYAKVTFTTETYIAGACTVRVSCRGVDASTGDALVEVAVVGRA